MAYITVCARCGRLYEAASEEAANEPIETGRPDARWCLDCLLSAPCLHCGRGRGEATPKNSGYNVAAESRLIRVLSVQ